MPCYVTYYTVAYGNGTTVEPRLADTPEMRTPRLCGHYTTSRPTHQRIGIHCHTLKCGHLANPYSGQITCTQQSFAGIMSRDNTDSKGKVQFTSYRKCWVPLWKTQSLLAPFGCTLRDHRGGRCTEPRDLNQLLD